jgi:hypothetical protein
MMDFPHPAVVESTCFGDRVTYIRTSWTNSGQQVAEQLNKILWRIDPLLGNGSLNIFLWKRTCETIGCLLLGNGSVNTPKIIRRNRGWYFPWGPPQGYITGSSKRAVSFVRSWACSVEEEFNCVSCCQELGRVLEIAVERDWKETVRK